jgi:hypothetical protein
VVLERGAEVGESIEIGRELREFDCVIDQNTTVHRYKWRGTTYATYQSSAPWVNVKTSNALVDWTDVDGLEQLMDDLIDPHTGEPIVIEPTHLITTRELLHTVNFILASTEVDRRVGGYAVTGNMTGERMANQYKGKYQHLTSRLLKSRLATDTDWFLGNPSKAFRYMENWPLTVVQAPSNSEAEFQQDIVQRYKVSERGVFSVRDPRLMGKSTVA